MELQREQVERLAERLPLPQLRLPFLFAPDLGLPEIETLASTLLAQVGELDALPGIGGSPSTARRSS
jgi:hypothetical protein